MTSRLVPTGVSAVLAKMSRDPVGSGVGGGEGRSHRVGMIAAASVPDRRDMIDIDAEAEMIAHAWTVSLRLPGFSAGTAASSGGSESGL